MRKEGILFDLDGTLWEVIDATYESVSEIVNKYNLVQVSKKTICNTFGLNKVESAQSYFPYLKQDEALKMLEESEILKIKNLKKYGGNLYPNLEDTIKILKDKYELFIVSNTAKSEYIEAFLITSGLEGCFKDYIAASEIGISKADAIKKIIDDYQLQYAIYVGDTQKDMEAAVLANIPFIQAKYGFGEDLKTKYYVDEIKELPNVIEQIY